MFSLSAISVDSFSFTVMNTFINPDNYQSHLFTDIKDIHAQNISDDLDPEDDEWNEEAFVIRIELVDGTEIDLD